VCSSDWYEHVSGFDRVVIEEQENSVSAAILRHPAGIFICLHHAPERLPRWDGPAMAVPALSFKLPGYTELAAWEQHLRDLGVVHSALHEAHLGWAVDVIDPDCTCIQLHTREGR
jgi:hypothetical protein